MRCPFCNHDDSKVVDKRETGSSNEITRRRRECLNCSKRFTTYEKVEDINLLIVKKDGRREAFNRNKVFEGMQKACEKRPVSANDINESINDIEIKMRSFDSQEIPSKKLGELIMKKLKKLDKVAYIRFASVYRDFADLDSFENELRKLLKK